MYSRLRRFAFVAGSAVLFVALASRAHAFPTSGGNCAACPGSSNSSLAQIKGTTVTSPAFTRLDGGSQSGIPVYNALIGGTVTLQEQVNGNAGNLYATALTGRITTTATGSAAKNDVVSLVTNNVVGARNSALNKLAFAASGWTQQTTNSITYYVSGDPANPSGVTVGQTQSITLNIGATTSADYYALDLKTAETGPIGFYQEVFINAGSADVGNTTGTTYGTALTSNVASVQSYAGLRSTTTAGAGGAIGTDAILQAGLAPAAGATVSMHWRNLLDAEKHNLPVILANGATRNQFLISDVVNLTTAAAGSVTPFALQMSCNPALLLSGNEAGQAASGHLFLASKNATSGLWKNAVVDNVGGTHALTPVLSNWATYVSGHPDLNADLGTWSVDTATHSAWAVVNHNSDFAVVPEPGTLALLAMLGLFLPACVWRSRRRAA